MFRKIAEVKKEIGKLSKTANNPFFKSKYLDLNEILDNLEPLLEKHGLLLLQPIQGGDVTTMIIDIESGKEIQSSMTLPSLTDPQKMGSAITYYRRYSLVSLLSLQAVDDDGNLASAKVEKKPEPVEEIVLTEKHPKWLAVCKAVETGKKTVEEIAEYYKCSEYIIGVLNMVSGKGEKLTN